MYSVVSVATPENSEARTFGSKACEPRNVSTNDGHKRFIRMRYVMAIGPILFALDEKITQSGVCLNLIVDNVRLESAAAPSTPLLSRIHAFARSTATTRSMGAIQIVVIHTRSLLRLP